MNFYRFIRPLLFKLEPELAHTLALKALKLVPQALISAPKGQQPVKALGLSFPHYVGLAAGLDKNGCYLDALAKLNFAFIELGTVTPKPQIGNPKPCLFRIPELGALINRMGFNNAGVQALVRNISASSYQGILGINIGKNKDTALNYAADDYIYCLRKVYHCASYITVNISSPNTPNLRELQKQEYLFSLLTKLTKERQILSDQHKKYLPLLIKISPDENVENLKHIAEVVCQQKIEGIIATNTTIKRSSAMTDFAFSKEEGGLSGAPLFEDSTQCLSLLKSLVNDDVTLIGVGGVNSADTAQAKLKAGAKLLQVYTGLIYEGPSLIANILSHLREF